MTTQFSKGQRVRSLLNPHMTYRVVGGAHGYIHLVAETVGYFRCAARARIPRRLTSRLARDRGQQGAQPAPQKQHIEIKMTTPNFKRPLITGLVSAISTTCREHGRQWEALRCLWLHNALTWDEFLWLEHLEIVLGQWARNSTFGITPLPNCQGWDEVISRTNASVERAIKLEEDRKAFGLQAAFDLSRAA